MPRKHINARPVDQPGGFSAKASTAWAALAVMLKRTDERPPALTGGPSAQPRVDARREPFRGQPTGT